MKNIFGLLALTLSVAAIAAPAKPLITKSSGGGFVMPEYAGYERCEVFQNKVVITRQYGSQAPNGLKVVEVRNISLGGDVLGVIERAKAEKIETKPNNLCDGPHTGISANDTKGEDLLLFATGGCGSPRLRREGVLSEKLRDIVGLYCEKTYDFSDPNNNN